MTADCEAKVVYWHRELPPLDAELMSEHTIEAIAQQVGYHNPFVFSNAFTKWIGWRPSEYRRKKMSLPAGGPGPARSAQASRKRA